MKKPSIRIPKTIKGRTLGLIILSVLILGWNAALSTQRENLSGHFQQVVKEDVRLKVTATGKIEPKEFKNVRAEFNGRRLKVHVPVGSEVKKDQLIMEISGDEIELELTNKRNSYQNAKVDMIGAKRDYEVEKKLYRQQAVPARDVEAAKQKYQRSFQAFKIAEREFELTKKKAEGVEVRAPIDGVLIANNYERDEWVKSGNDVITVAKLNDFAVRVKVDELDISQVNVGQPALIELDAFSDQKLVGEVSWVGVQAAEGAFAEIDVLVDIKDSKGLEIKPNLSAEVEIVTGEVENALVIPKGAVRRDDSGTFVLARRIGGWLSPVPIKVWQMNAGRAILEDGLTPGQKVLVSKED